VEDNYKDACESSTDAQYRRILVLLSFPDFRDQHYSEIGLLDMLLKKFPFQRNEYSGDIRSKFKTTIAAKFRLIII